MRTFWKVFAALALMLPLGAFVAGSLVSSAADEPRERDTIVLEDSATPTPTPTPTAPVTPTPTPTPTPTRTPDPATPATSADIPEASQTPDDFDDDNSGHGNGGDDDSSGHGGGDDDDDDNSGPGNGDDRDDDD